uniref:BLE2 protein n=1 Tax=Leersia perrieri TaxID=77586 RepID=A0A0D9X2B2_9ORYZ
MWTLMFCYILIHVGDFPKLGLEIHIASCGEHRIQMPEQGGCRRRRRRQQVAAPPEKWLNGFVRLVALIERVGNAIGALAFMWATVVLLGGYPTVLRSNDDFSYATAIIFLEAARMFSRNNTLDYRVFFCTRGAFRPAAGWNGLITVACISNALISTFLSSPVSLFWSPLAYIMVVAILVIVKFLSSVVPKLLICKPICRVISLWSPVVAILLQGPYMIELYVYHPQLYVPRILEISLAKWMVAYVLLLVVVLLVTISGFQFPIIIKLLDSTLGSKQVWRRITLNLCVIASLLMPILIIPVLRVEVITVEGVAIVLASFGNLQIPAAIVRVALTLLRLIPHYYYGQNEHIDENNLGDKKNLAGSLNIFYGMVLVQGTLYIAACIFEFFSFIPRRSLICHGGFRGQWGVASVNLYYTYAFEKYMEGGVLAPKKISLINFAIVSLNSDSPKMQLYGVQMLHSFLQREPTRERLITKLSTSTNSMARLISMLGWTSPNHTIVRLYAAKVTVELAKSLQVVTVTGTVQLVCALLDTDDKQKMGNPLLDADSDHEGKQDPIYDAADDQCQLQEPLRDADNLIETQTQSTNQNKQDSFIVRGWQRISEYWSIPKEQPLTDNDLLPALGMLIVDNLASYDQNNCVEIGRETDLIPKIIGFTCFRSDTTNSDTQQMVLVKSSLKVLQRLTSIGGEIGIALRYKISKHPFLLRNLAEILGDDINGEELRKLVAVILRNLAINVDTRQEIGHMQVLITRLTKAFLNFYRISSTNVDSLLPKFAGQALAILAIDNVHNCLVMLKEPEFIHKLKSMIFIHNEKYTYVAASLLCSMCQHARAKITESDLKELSHTLREVLDKIMNAQGAKLEILIGLSSQICKVIPEEFSRELESGQIKRRFMKRLVDSLNENINPHAHCPGIRRVILEQSIYMMECNSHYVNCFNELRIMEALSMVQKTPSRAENYRIFLGDVGFMEYNTPLIDLTSTIYHHILER